MSHQPPKQGHLALLRSKPDPPLRGQCVALSWAGRPMLPVRSQHSAAKLYCAFPLQGNQDIYSLESLRGAEESALQTGESTVWLCCVILNGEQVSQRSDLRRPAKKSGAVSGPGTNKSMFDRYWTSVY